MDLEDRATARHQSDFARAVLVQEERFDAGEVAGAIELNAVIACGENGADLAEGEGRGAGDDRSVG